MDFDSPGNKLEEDLYSLGYRFERASDPFESTGIMSYNMAMIPASLVPHRFIGGSDIKDRFAFYRAPYDNKRVEEHNGQMQTC